MKRLPNVISALRIAGSIGLLCHSLVAGTGDSRLALYLGRGDCLHQDGEPGMSPGRLQTILFSSYMGQQADRFPAFPDGADNVLVNDSDFHRCCSGYVCRRPGGATATFETLNMPFQMMSMPVVTSQYWNIVYGREPGQAALDREGLQTMRTLANNMAALLRATGGKPMPGSDEPWDGMHFIR